MFSRTLDFLKSKDVASYASGTDAVKEKSSATQKRIMTAVLVGIAALTPLQINSGMPDHKIPEPLLNPANAIELSGVFEKKNEASGISSQQLMTYVHTDDALIFQGDTILNKGDTLTFTLSGDKGYFKRIEDVVQATFKSPTAGSSLKTFSKIKGSLAMQEGMGDLMGSFLATTKCITLNPQFDNAELTSTLCHEVAHAEQYATTRYFLTTTLDSESFFLLGAAMEADACVDQYFACRELSDKGNKRPLANFKSTRYEMVKAMEAAQKSGLSREESAKIGAKAYFKTDIVDYYKNFYTDALLSIKDDGRIASDTLSVDQIASRICKTAGKSYFTGEELHASGALNISKNNYKRLEGLEKRASEENKEKASSYQYFTVLSGKKIVQPPLKKRTFTDTVQIRSMRSGFYQR